MITFILAAVISLFFAVALWIITYQDSYSWAGRWIGSTFGAILVVAIGMGLLWVLPSYIITVAQGDSGMMRVADSQTPLRALGTGSGGHGSFFLGSGYTEDGPIYTYLYKDYEGGWAMDSVATESAQVFETKNGKAYLERAHYNASSNLWTLFSAPAELRFYVPAGSVQEPSYDVNVNGSVNK